jgi:hypothetical protein
MKLHKLTIPLVALTALSFMRSHKVDEWKYLFNGKNLDGWDTWIGPALDDAGKMLSKTPVGLNNDPNHVFTIVKDKGGNVIRISGENWGGISTIGEYENFHLQLMFKWGSLKWGQKKNKKRDSGLLYFAVGAHGADYGAWMRSQEFQIQEGDCGDYWGVAGGMEDIPAIKKSDSEYVYNSTGRVYNFSATSNVGRHCIKQGDAEKASGEWNVLDLYCHGDTSVHVINGKVMMVLYHSQQSDNGKVAPLKKGKLQIQSEGAEVYYNQIRIKSLDVIPSDLLK